MDEPRSKPAHSSAGAEASAFAACARAALGGLVGIRCATRKKSEVPKKNGTVGPTLPLLTERVQTLNYLEGTLRERLEGPFCTLYLVSLGGFLLLAKKSEGTLGPTLPVSIEIATSPSLLTRVQSLSSVKGPNPVPHISQLSGETGPQDPNFHPLGIWKSGVRALPFSPSSKQQNIKYGRCMAPNKTGAWPSWMGSPLP